MKHAEHAPDVRYEIPEAEKPSVHAWVHEHEAESSYYGRTVEVERKRVRIAFGGLASMMPNAAVLPDG